MATSTRLMIHNIYCISFCFTNFRTPYPTLWTCCTAICPWKSWYAHFTVIAIPLVHNFA